MPLEKEIANASERILIEQASGGSNAAAKPFEDRVDLQRIVPAIILRSPWAAARPH
jgi:hypothetical protein